MQFGYVSIALCVLAAWRRGARSVRRAPAYANAASIRRRPPRDRTVDAVCR